MKLLEYFSSQALTQAKHGVIPVGNREAAFTDKQTPTYGTDKDVEINLPLSKQHKWMAHTHPNKNPSLFTTLPSIQDLNAAINLYKNGVPEMIIHSGNFYIMLKPKSDNINTTGYIQSIKDAVAKNDINIVISKLKSMGFDIEIGNR